MKKSAVFAVLALTAGGLFAQNILEGYAPVASPSGAYRYIRTISDTKSGGNSEFDILDIKTNAVIAPKSEVTELKVYGTAKTEYANMEVLNVGKMDETTGGYVKAKIAHTDTSADYTIQDKADINTYRAELKGGSNAATLKLSNTKLFPNTLPGTGNNALLSGVGKQMEWKALKDSSGNQQTILVINMTGTAPSCTALTSEQQSNCTSTGGTYNSGSCTCTCSSDRPILNLTTYKCTAQSSGGSSGSSGSGERDACIMTNIWDIQCPDPSTTMGNTYFANPSNCWCFYECAWGDNLPLALTCPSGTYFCSEKNVCSYPNDPECSYSDCYMSR
ncbi:Chitin binding Peritrophin-A domain-containing protein [Parelusimicrobium proximum]|uniref:chitin binding peritrophin-A domain-containing protein n=1 Tax=Parelusimicrobium proximum TaxID=3228953 RepID=UPI003D1835AA